MQLDINKSQLSELGKRVEQKNAQKQKVLNELKQTKEISTDMLQIIGMPFEVFLKYAKLKDKDRQKIVNKAIKKLEPDYCESCECTPCDCGYGSY